MSKKICRKKVAVLFLCSWVMFTSNSAVAIPSRGCLDCASFTANIAKIFDTLYKLFGSSGNNNNNRERHEEITVEVVEDEYFELQNNNNVVARGERYEHFLFRHSRNL